jgi:hypothetical protein
MKQSFLLAAALGLVILCGGPAPAQTTKFLLGFDLPGELECGGKITGNPGEKVQFDVLGTITQSEFVANKGASGWSIGFRGENLTFVPDTAASGATCGTTEVIIPIPEFFCSASLVDPGKTPESGPLSTQGPQGQGVVDGLALQIGKSLQGNASFNIIKVKAEATIPATGSVTARLVFLDGLQGPGQPVTNGITAGGKTENVAGGNLTLGECVITLEAQMAVQKPGDFNQDGALDLDDSISLLGHLFKGDPGTLPCSGDIYSAGNKGLLDANGDGEVDVSDVIYNLRTQFLGGPPHAAGTACIPITGCGGVDNCQS